jgi:hypothetical protein
MADELTTTIGGTSQALRDTPLGFPDLTDEFHFRLALAGLLRQTAIQLAARGIDERAKRPLTAVESLTQVAALLTSTAEDLPVLENEECDCEHAEPVHSLKGCSADDCFCAHLTGLPDVGRDQAVEIFTKALAVVPGARPDQTDPLLAMQL